MNWRVKATLQKTLAALPSGIGGRINRDMPAVLRRRPADPAARAVPIARLHLEPLARMRPAAPVEVLEIGTGYNLFLALPVALVGHRVVTVDLDADLSESRVRALADGLASRVDELAALPAALLDARAVAARLDAVRSAPGLDGMLAAAGIEYEAPYDMDAFGVRNAGRFGYVASHCVFEHVPPAAFPPLLRMLRTVSAPGAPYSHQVDMRDHRSSEGFLVDSRLSFLDYLTFSERRWRFWNGNALAYTNRWRRSDYRGALEAAGLPVDSSVDVVYPGDALPLQRAALHPDFRHHPDDELRVMASLLCGHAPRRP